MADGTRLLEKDLIKIGFGTTMCHDPRGFTPSIAYSPSLGVIVIVDSSANDQEMAVVSEESSRSPLYPLSSHSPSPLSGDVVGCDLQGSTSSVNVDWPWDWNIMDNVFAQGIGDGNVGWGEL